MDFATSQPGETRLLVLTLINLLSIDCPCTLFLTSPNSVFQLPQTQYTLGPKEKRYITIKFLPTELKKYSAKIGIVAFGGQVQWYPHKILILRVSLSGVSRSLLKVYDSRIDFGPVDIFYNGVTRKIMLENTHKTIPLQVQYTASTSGISLNDGLPLILEAGEKRGVPVEFISEYSGARDEVLRLFSLNSELVEVGLAATSEMVITCPVADRIYLPTCNLGEQSNITFPIRNDSEETVQIELTFPIGSLFQVSLQRLETSNTRRNMSISTDQGMDSEILSGEERFGIVIVCRIVFLIL
jgi:hypothetical protein